MKIYSNHPNGDISVPKIYQLVALPCMSGSRKINLSGKIPVKSILLHMYVTGDTINGLPIFKIFVVISSYP
jgi:hypothetical protein